MRTDHIPGKDGVGVLSLDRGWPANGAVQGLIFLPLTLTSPWKPVKQNVFYLTHVETKLVTELVRAGYELKVSLTPRHVLLTFPERSLGRDLEVLQPDSPAFHAGPPPSG